MPRCRDNRRRTARRRRKQERRFRDTMLWLNWIDMCPGDLNHRYYEPHQVRYLTKYGGTTIVVKFKTRPNTAYRRMVKELAEKCRGVTVDLNELFKGKQNGTSNNTDSTISSA